MNTHAERAQENKSQSVAENLSKKQSGCVSSFQFVDNRPVAIAQRKLQELTNNSSQVKQMKANGITAHYNTIIQLNGDDSGYEADVEDNVKTPAIKNPGEYLGYTLGGNSPTFYFQNGHYTTQHKDSQNVGWHPNKGERHFIKNISEAAHELYSSKRGEWQREAKTKFGQAVERGGLDAKPNEGLMMEGDVYTKEQGNEEIYLHPSRGRLIRPTDKDFNPKYSESYAQEIIKRGQLAPNEKRKKILKRL